MIPKEGYALYGRGNFQGLALLSATIVVKKYLRWIYGVSSLFFVQRTLPAAIMRRAPRTSSFLSIWRIHCFCGLGSSLVYMGGK